MKKQFRLCLGDSHWYQTEAGRRAAPARRRPGGIARPRGRPRRAPSGTTHGPGSPPGSSPPVAARQTGRWRRRYAPPRSSTPAPRRPPAGAPGRPRRQKWRWVCWQPGVQKKGRRSAAAGPHKRSPATGGSGLHRAPPVPRRRTTQPTDGPVGCPAGPGRPTCGRQRAHPLPRRRCRRGGVGLPQADRAVLAARGVRSPVRRVAQAPHRSMVAFVAL
mmetsp:Transcript_12949/g.23029  ORF Transcript_12949/g.23029 Transcript_12949/m.23029 type:complete len:217 (-) Transcript_12949:833-1483(-)